MTAAGELYALAERCEQTTGDDTLELINLECDICAALGIETGTHGVPFTSSVDASITLLPKAKMPLAEYWKVEAYTDNGVLAEHVRASAWVAGAGRVFAATPALALCAAALRARAASGMEARQGGNEVPCEARQPDGNAGTP